MTATASRIEQEAKVSDVRENMERLPPSSSSASSRALSIDGHLCIYRRGVYVLQILEEVCGIHGLSRETLRSKDTTLFCHQRLERTERPCRDYIVFVQLVN